MGELNVATRSLASALSCETTVTVISLCANGVLHGESKTVVRELTGTSGINRYNPRAVVRLKSTDFQKQSTKYSVVVEVQHGPHFT